jgi:serine/threonine protein kinase
LSDPRRKGIVKFGNELRRRRGIPGEMPKFIRRTGRSAETEATSGGVVVRPPLSESAVIPHGAEIAGYRIGPQLGRGGMGVVYKAHHLRLDRAAAVKVLTPVLAQNDEFRERFIRESQMAATLQHPNVITVYDAGDDQGLLYLAMQFVAGTDLRRLLELEGPLEPARALNVLAQVAGALDAAHAHGLVHRDVKPANVLVDIDRAYLGDFGLTKRFDATGGMTGVGQILGTVDYLAPEQIDSGRVDGRTDLYALGCVAYECLAGRPPHQKDSDVAILFAHVREEPAPLSSLVHDVPESADDVMSKALAKNLDDRYSSCREFIFDLAMELGVDSAELISQEPSSHVVVASEDPTTRAIVRGSLANMGVAVSEVGAGVMPTWLGERRFDALIADATFDREALAGVRASGGDPAPKLLLLVGRDGSGCDWADVVRADEELAQPFSGMQLAMKLRRLIGAQAVRV